MENAASRFGQRLAHTEKKYRDQALRKLTSYLTQRSTWTALELDKLWKAIFYCMWMSDKPKVQQELAANLAQLMHKIPSTDIALEFIHSFFRTMHREWPGLDQLRLDKFYFLFRQFLHESVALLAANDWNLQYVETFVSMLSTEIVSQKPNGLRLHISDIFIEEVFTAGGDSISTPSFMLLLEPFFSLLSSEYDRAVYKRIHENIFTSLVDEYEFADSVEKDDVSDDKEGDETDEEEETKKFANVEVRYVQHRIFRIAAADDTVERNRSQLYELYNKFYSATHVDSFKAGEKEEKKLQAEVEKKRKKDQRKRKQEEVKVEETEEQEKATKKQKKSKESAPVEEVEKSKKKTKKQNTDEPAVVETKKSKKKTTEDSAVVETKKSKKKKTDDSEIVETKKSKKQVAEAPAEKEKEKSKKKDKKRKADEMADTQVKTPETSKKAKEAEDPNVVIRSGKKFQRCSSCRGFGKGFIPKNKTMCRHCERAASSSKQAKNKTKKVKKKQEKQANMDAEEEKKANAKKVTFGTNKALKHEVSVKRLKASAKKKADDEALAKSIKGVLKKSDAPKVKKGKKRAADFF